MKQELQKLIYKVTGMTANIEHPATLEHGDYSTNIALKIGSEKLEMGSWKQEVRNGNPMEIANEIVNAIRSAGMPDYISKIEVAVPGFINIFLSPEILIAQTSEVLKQKDSYGQNNLLKNKKIILEHTSPNPQTTIMLGHLRNNFLGMSVANLLMASGAEVSRDCIVNDRGTHVCRAIFGYLVFGQKTGGLGKKELADFKEITDEKVLELGESRKWKELLEKWSKNPKNWYIPEDLKLKPDHANLIWYVIGSRAYKSSDKVRVQVEEILKAWEENPLTSVDGKTTARQGKSVRKIWKLILDWSKKGYAETYKRIGSHHDWFWNESDHYQAGKDIVKEGLKNKVFKESEGALVTDLAKFGLSDTVVQKTDGTALYITQDLALTKMKLKKFKADQYIWDIGMEQELYMKQLFAICSQLGIGKGKDFFHLSYALINFKGGGKMATRQGNVVMADEILDLLKMRAKEIMKASNQDLRGKLTVGQLDSLAEQIAVGAVKYSLLKYGRETTIFFDIEESLSLEGDSGPYLQYTVARCNSILQKWEIGSGKLDSRSVKLEKGTKKSKNQDIPFQYPASHLSSLTSEELVILRTIYRFPEVVQSATQNYSPNMICNFLFDLAQKYNNFYNTHRILGGNDKDQENFRLALTAATGQVIKNGLELLGIDTPERM